MRRSTLIRFLAIVLVISMLAAPISAAGLGTAANESNEWGGLIGIIIEIIRNIFDSWFRQDEPAEPAAPVTSTEPGGTSTSTEAGAAAPAETVPGEPVAENPVYEQTQTGGSQNADVDLSATGNAPVTMGNVSMGLNPMGTVSNVTTTADGDTVTYGFTNWVNGGQYYIQNARANFNGANSWLRAENNEVVSTDFDNATLFTMVILDNGKFTLSYDDNGTAKYLYLNTNNGAGTADEFSTDAQELTLEHFTTGTVHHNGGVILEDDGHFIRIGSNSKWLCQYGGVNVTAFGSEQNSTDSGVAMWFHLFKDGTTSKVTYGVIEPEQPTPDPEEPDVPEGDSVAHTDLTWQQVKDGTYYADKACTNQVTVTPVGENGNGYTPVTITASNSAIHEFTEYADGTYYYLNGSTYERITSISSSRFGVTAWYVYTDASGTYHYVKAETITIYKAGGATGYNLTDANGNVLATLNGTDLSTTVDVTLYTPKAGDTEEPEQPQVDVVYFPVTMYNYHTDALNNATKALDGDTVFRGLYFFNGSPDYTKSTTSDLSNFVAGQYYIQNIRAAENNVNSWISYHVSADNMAMIRAESKDDATLWTLEVEGGNYYLSTTVNGTKLYLTLNGSGADADSFTENKTAITISGYAHNAEGVQLSKGGNYLCQWNGVDQIYFGGYGVNNDGGNGMKFYPVGSNTPVAPGASVTKITAGYEEWNRWDKASGDNSKGDLFYTGLVQDEMVDDQIVFNIPQAGIFTDVDDDTKDVYQFVGMPFELRKYTEKDNAGKLGVYYTFDSDRNGVYFKGAPQSGTSEDEMHKLHFAPLAPQPMPHDVDVGDHSTNAFLPYNNSWTNETNADGTVVGRYSDWIDYHFGMRADLPFAMTQNGRIKATDDESEPITFTFSGDDDVWVFIDGHLVIDLGGIHNRLDATINFAENTITYSEENGQDTNNNTGSYNDSTFATTQQLFTANGVEGVIPMSRDAFALDPDHEMQVFYLERGKGTSNGRIEFNLPMNDTVIVTKDATKSWSQAAYERDEEAKTKDEDDWGVESLTVSEQAAIDNIDFGFTLYKKTAGAESFTPVVNTNFYLIGRGVEGTVIRMTDSKGHFYLKNGQSAKFLTDLPTEGVTYYVVEDKVPDGFIAPDFNYAGKASYDFTWVDAAETGDTGTAPAADASKIPEQIIPMPEKDSEGNLIWHDNKSYEVTVKGSVENQDSIEFICSNFMDAELPNPTAIANEDIIVIDYGLPVQIDPLANDICRGDLVGIVYWGDENLTLEAYHEGFKNGTLDYNMEYEFGTLDITYGMTSETISTRDIFTYTLNEQLTEVEVITYIVRSFSTETNAAGEVETAEAYSLGRIYICPATVMYYEENFSDMVTFTGNNWVGEVTTGGASDYQEPGVVGTVGDSIYGSDVAYRNDSEDSNGTSYYGDTTNSAIRFSYSFTGTGTTIFARTSANTGYMQVKIYKGTDTTGKYMNISYRDTYWKDENLTELDAGGTLYNIPVYTQEDLEYGTYTVVCTIAKAGTPTAGNDAGAGNEFYLDGIRVMQPLNIVGEEIYDEENDDYIYEYDAMTEKALGAYATDGESNIDTYTLRYKLITDHEGGYDEDAGETESKWPFAVMTDIDGDIVYASDYVSIGPKEEVYLLPGQSVSFSIKYWHQDGYQIHMGMKAPFGSAEVKVGQTTFALNHAADCYYDITGMQYSVTNEVDEKGKDCYIATYTFTATDRIVSLTNIKVVGDYEFVIVEDTDVEIPGDVGGNG